MKQVLAALMALSVSATQCSINENPAPQFNGDAYEEYLKCLYDESIEQLNQADYDLHNCRTNHIMEMDQLTNDHQDALAAKQDELDDKQDELDDKQDELDDKQKKT